MMESVFRIQDKTGRGPFRPGFSHVWSDEYFAPNMEFLPTFIEEFGHDIITKNFRRGEWYGSAVRKITDLAKWFSPTERERLRELGFNVVCIRPNRVLAESEHQIVFARRRPLHKGVIVAPWIAIDVDR